jgi:hypothetical protein
MLLIKNNLIMKLLFSIIALFLYSTAFSQVIIGNAVGTVPAGQKTSVLLEFAAGQNKGIVLPYLRTLPSGIGLTEGTIILDARDATKAKIKYYNGVTDMQSSDGWFDLSNGNAADISTVIATAYFCDCYGRSGSKSNYWRRQYFCRWRFGFGIRQQSNGSSYGK